MSNDRKQSVIVFRIIRMIKPGLMLLQGQIAYGVAGPDSDDQATSATGTRSEMQCLDTKVNIAAVGRAPTLVQCRSSTAGSGSIGGEKKLRNSYDLPRLPWWHVYPELQMRGLNYMDLYVTRM